MDEKAYFEERLDNQIEWYDSKSSWHQEWFKRLRILEILSAASIPFLTGYITDQTQSIRIVVGSLGILIAVISGVVALFKFQEHWLQYRTTSESLKHNKYLYLTKTAPYDNGNAFNLLVNSVENLISKENSNWVSYIKEKARSKKDV